MKLFPMSTAWRIVRKAYAGSAFTGEGAKNAKFGGRFNSHGTAIVYASDSYALALLEVRIHVVSFRGLRDRVVFEVEIDEDLMDIVDEADLPADWRSRPPSKSTQRIGDDWVASGRTAVLRVPSVVVPSSSNFLLNPAHPDFSQLRIHGPTPVDLDPRLMSS